MTYRPPTPNGITTPDASSPVVMSAQTIAGVARTAPAINYEFLTNSTNGWFDTLGYTWVSFFIANSAAVTGGVIQFECTNDTALAPNGVALIVQDEGVVLPARQTSLTLAGGAVNHYTAPITARYIRVRVSTAVTGATGTVTIAATLKHAAPAINSQMISFANSLPTSATVMGGITMGINTSNIGILPLTAKLVYDLNGSVLSATGSTSFINLFDSPAAACFGVSVSNVSGTSTILDVKVEGSVNGTNPIDLYHFERITTIGSWMSPTIRLNNSYIRYTYTISGTSPLLTTTLVHITSSSSNSNTCCYYDRTISAPTTGNTTAAYTVQGTTQVQMVINSSTATGASVFQLQGSEDGTDWYNIGSPLTTHIVATSLSAATSLLSHSANMIRAICTTSGTGQTLSYISFTAMGP